MTVTRRNILLGGAALAALPRFAAAQAGPEQLHAAAYDLQLLPEDYGRTTLWGYGNSTPGTEIRVAQGARVRRQLVNDLKEPTSIHWHGIRIDNAMDGVSGLTQEAVPPGATFDYDFVAPDAGTFWYHAHNRSFEQVGRGLYGALIVEEPDALDIDRDVVMLLDDWLVDPDTSQLVDGFGAPHDLSHGGRTGNFITTNGAFAYEAPVKRHERLRLRLINAANARVFQLQLEGLEGWIVALDGMPLAEPRAISDPIVLGPAQRADVIVDVTAEAGKAAYLVRAEGRDVFPQAAFPVSEGGATARRGTPPPLPPNQTARPDLAKATALDLRMEGGAMGGLRGATMQGEPRSMRQLVEAGQFWAFNGAVGSMDGPPLAELARGEPVRIKIINDTVFPHAMHLHGMHFHEVTADGALGDLRDTTLVSRGETREIAFVADNPGDWLLHCHMLSHAVSGMTTRIKVA
ncbi:MULTISPECIES: multicopper oxidase family protein [unclassified Marinovum]